MATIDDHIRQSQLASDLVDALNALGSPFAAVLEPCDVTWDEAWVMRVLLPIIERWLEE